MQRSIADLAWVLANGCGHHQAYRGKKEPKGDCAGCAAVYVARRELSQQIPDPSMDVGRYEGPYSALCRHCFADEEHTPEQHWRSVSDLMRGC